MVMEYADSGTLECMARPFSNHWSEIARESKLLAERLATLHGLSFTHGDLHPGNVVFIKVEHVNSPYLIDVGLSRSVENGQGERGVYGRRDYLPPEIFQGASYTQASDIYCFGTLLWQSITGVPPRGTANIAVNTFPDGLREELIPGAPEYLNEILRQTWNPIPTSRPSIHQVLDRLQLRETYTAFSEETLAFIAKRKAAYSLEKTLSVSSGSMSSCSTSSSSVSVIPLRKSQFHTFTSLRAMSPSKSIIGRYGYEEVDGGVCIFKVHTIDEFRDTKDSNTTFVYQQPPRQLASKKAMKRKSVITTAAHMVITIGKKIVMAACSHLLSLCVLIPFSLQQIFVVSLDILPLLHQKHHGKQYRQHFGPRRLR